MLFVKKTDISLSSDDTGAELARSTTSPPFHLLPVPVMAGTQPSLQTCHWPG